jgi:hypothetical protein
MAHQINPRVIEALKRLNEKDQELLARVLRVERDKLYQERPRVKEDLLKAVREVYK